MVIVSIIFKIKCQQRPSNFKMYIELFSVVLKYSVSFVSHVYVLDYQLEGIFVLKVDS